MLFSILYNILDNHPIFELICIFNNVDNSVCSVSKCPVNKYIYFLALLYRSLLYISCSDNIYTVDIDCYLDFLAHEKLAYNNALLNRSG